MSDSGHFGLLVDQAFYGSAYAGRAAWRAASKLGPSQATR